MNGWQVESVLKSDAFGRVELMRGPRGRAVRRVACGSAIPFSRAVAGLLLERERRALARLDGLAGLPRLLSEPARDAHGARVLLRSFVEGAPLSAAEELPVDFFDRLDELALALHERGVCHNDLHKEQNVLVGADGFPWLVDFQLASCHRGRGRRFASRARDDLRHLEKHRRRYTRDGRGPQGSATPERGAGHGLARSRLARLWRRWVKPRYDGLKRRLGWRDSEERRPSSGPWPRWIPAVGPRAGRDCIAGPPP